MMLLAPLVTRDASGALSFSGAAGHLISMTLTAATTRVWPDLAAVGGSSDLRHIVGALLTYSLLLCVTMLIVSAVSWAIASASGSWQGASRAKVGVGVALGGAVLTGGALAWANWLVGVGAAL